MTGDLRLGHTTVLAGARGGKYPDGNSLLVAGPEGTLVIDPSLSVVARAGTLPRADLVLNSHCHEDHVAGNHCFRDAPWWVHEGDRPGLAALDGLMAIYGFDGALRELFAEIVVRDFRYEARPDARGFADGAVFDLGGAVRVRALHTPGHTRGHCCFLIEPDGVVFLGDIDLSGFGPYYGDAWSSLEDFTHSLARVRDLDARWYATFHHVGVLQGRAAFLERLDRFAGVIGAREARLLAYLAEPRTLDEIVAHRFVYRPGDAVPYADAVERRSMTQHLDRLLRTGAVREVEPGRYVRI